MFSYEITSQKEAKNGFFKLLDQVATNHDILIIDRDQGENVALIAESDLRSLVETVYLMRSPAFGQRLLEAIEESKSGKIKPQSMEELILELELEQKKEELG